jgi:hypothetical protein
MATGTWKRVAVGALAAALLGTFGCSHHKAEVRDDQLARVPEAQMAPVHTARSQHLQAEDDVQRAQVKVDDAKRALEVARHEADAARAEEDAARTKLQAAREQGRQAGITSAQKEADAAEAAVAAADAKVAWREKVVGALEARATLAQREEGLAKARLNMAEFRALDRSGDVRANELSEADFQAAIAQAQGDVEQARRTLDDAVNEARQAHAAWQKAHQDEAVGGSGEPEKDGLRNDVEEGARDVGSDVRDTARGVRDDVEDATQKD